MLKKFLLFLILLTPHILFAQNNTLTGNIFDNDSRSIALEGATIKNLNTKSFAMADKNGHFAIEARVGDLVSFGMVGYETDTIYLTKLLPKNVYLRVNITNLKTVDINSVKLSPYLDLQPSNATPARAVDYSKERGGVRLSLGYGKYRKEQYKIQQLEENDRYQTEITKNFNEETVRQAVKFEGSGIKDFLALYRPTVDQIKGDKVFNYTYYIIKAYHTWEKLPIDQRKLPPLIKLKTN